MDTIDIIQYKRDHPGITASELGKPFGISRQYAHYIIAQARKKDPGIPGFSRDKSTKDYYTEACKYCGLPIISKYHRYGSHKACFYEHVGYVQLKCFNCRTRFPMKKSQYRYRLKHGQKNFYCSESCRSTGIKKRRNK